MLKATNITKSYAGVQALRSASLEVRAGEVHALVGENGAGKSTLIKIVTGAVQADGGTLEINGALVTQHDTTNAKALGVAAIYQQPALFADLTVAENIAYGNEPVSLWRRVNWRARHEQAQKLLQRVGAKIDPERRAGDLTMPEQQLVEIARALGQNARLLILDEPTASLGEEDAQNLFRVIRELREQGVAMVYISHRLEELAQIADRVTVLRDGQTIETRAMRDVTRDDLIRLMIGRELSAVFPKRAVKQGDIVLELRGVSCAAAGVSEVSLQIRAGEILGLAGLVGAGRTELARVLFGLTPADSGEIWLNGERVTIDSPTTAIARGIAYVPEDRRQHGVILPLPIDQNITLSSLPANGWLNFSAERTQAATMVQQLGVKTPSIFNAAGNLSGGNQQKVALAKWMATNPRVMILDEPTQGIDVGAKSEIHRLMCDLAEQGMAVLMISSELPEVLGMSDRIAVMHAGKVAGVLSREDATQEKVLALALGHVSSSPNHQMIRVDKALIERIWRRMSQDSRPPFQVQMPDGDFSAIDLYGDLGVGRILRSDGVVATWDIDFEEIGNETKYKIELDPNWCVAALVLASTRNVPELKEALPKRPNGARHCQHCDGYGFTDLPNAPKFFLCQNCWGLGWHT